MAVVTEMVLQEKQVQVVRLGHRHQGRAGIWSTCRWVVGRTITPGGQVVSCHLPGGNHTTSPPPPLASLRGIDGNVFLAPPYITL